MNQFLEHSEIHDIAEKVYAGERLSFDDGMRLYTTPNLLAVGVLANYANTQRNGNHVYFVENRHINPTNICTAHCNFCSFRRNGNEPDAYLWTVPEIMERAQQTITERTREFHIVSALHPNMKLDYYCDVVRSLKQAFPLVHIKAFTAVEIDYLARISGIDWRAVLTELKQAGVDAMPGGGAEIFHPDIRRKLCPEKVVANGWLAIHGIAHELGLITNATMLYGHIEQPEHRVDHLIRLRTQQDATGGFVAFVPLAYHAANNRLGHKLRTLTTTTGNEDLRNLAIGRLMLDNFPHIKSYWIMITPRLAQLSLSFGVSDMDGTVVEERITHDAGADTDQALPRETLIELIKGAGKIPVERDALYKEVQIYA